MNQEQVVPIHILLLGVWNHLQSRRRLQLGALFLVMLASGAAKVAGAVLPFLTVLTDLSFGNIL